MRERRMYVCERRMYVCHIVTVWFCCEGHVQRQQGLNSGVTVFFINLYAGFCHTFVCDFVCVFVIHLYVILYKFLSYICMRFCMRVFVIHLYACFFHTFHTFFSYICHTFLHLYLGWPWRSGECGRPINRELAVQSPLTAQQKDCWEDSWRRGSSPLCHG